MGLRVESETVDELRWLAPTLLRWLNSDPRLNSPCRKLANTAERAPNEALETTRFSTGSAVGLDPRCARHPDSASGPPWSLRGCHLAVVVFWMRRQLERRTWSRVETLSPRLRRPSATEPAGSTAWQPLATTRGAGASDSRQSQVFAPFTRRLRTLLRQAMENQGRSACCTRSGS